MIFIYSYKTKNLITSQKLGSRDFRGTIISVLNKGKSAIRLLFNGSEVLSSASDKAKLYPKNFSKNFNINDTGIYLPISLSRTNLKRYNIFVTLKFEEN